MGNGPDIGGRDKHRHQQKRLTGEFTGQALGRSHAGDDTAACDALEHVLAIPSDQVAVVDKVFLLGLEL